MSEGGPVLVVDLDGTLLKSDLLYETFWSATSLRWLAVPRAAVALARGRAALKRHLADAGRIDVAHLPYDDAVLDYVRRWRAQGGRTALVSASDAGLAEAVAGHLGLFDEVHGSDGIVNLKGAAKARFLAERFGGSTGYAYMGDCLADLPVWRSARRAITVNASPKVERHAAGLGVEVEHLRTRSGSAAAYLRAIRPHQWLKNLLVFVPLIAAHRLDAESGLRAVAAFFAFCFVASSVYVLNDLLDLAADRAHPRKRLRPFAAGAVPIAHGTWLIAGLLLLGMGLGAMLGWPFLAILLGYYALTTAYSLHLKRRIVIDICVLAGLYTIRMVAGAVATDVPLTVWLVAFSMFVFFSLASVKRQAELVDSAARGKIAATGRGYHTGDLPIIAMMALGSGYVSVLVLALYVNSPNVAQLYAEPSALWGACAVLLYWVTRMVFVTSRGEMHDDPLVFAAKDGASLLCLMLIAAFAIAGMLV